MNGTTAMTGTEGLGDVTVWVLARPDDPRLALLRKARAGASFVVGDRARDFPAETPPDAVLVWLTPRALLEEVFPKAAGARWIHSSYAGVDGLLFPALRESPVPLTNARGVFSASLAEFAIGGLVFFLKDFRRLIRNQAAEIWEPFDCEELRGRTLGIVGYGDIGRAVAERARAFGMRILALRRRPETCQGDPLVDRAFAPPALTEMIAACDDVVVAAPLTPDTRRMVGRREIEAMKSGGVFVNVGRGPVVDEPTLVEALEQKRIRGAALDVFETEPLPAGHPLYRLENVLLSPHCADHTPDWLDQSMECFLANLERFRKGESLVNLVDKARGY